MSLSVEMIAAVVAHDTATVRRLLDAGEDVNAANESGETAFSYACANDAFAVARLLHSLGANINTVDDGRGSPLDWAVCWSSHEFRAWLKSVGGKHHDHSSAEWPWPRDGTT